jgi:hypothetical protein
MFRKTKYKRFTIYYRSGSNKQSGSKITKWFNPSYGTTTNVVTSYSGRHGRVSSSSGFSNSSVSEVGFYV